MTPPVVPLTLEGSFVLHQMMRLRPLPVPERNSIVAQAEQVLAKMEPEQTAIYSMLGHKGDLMFLHYRRDLSELHRVELELARLRLWDYLEPATSYLSVVELGLYESTGRVWRMFSEQGLDPGSEQWNAALEEELVRQRKAMEPRLYPAVPDHRYLCFYPMDRKRGEDKNWYQVGFAERARMMQDHGAIGRKYADHVKQIISGSIGFDDWEWGVDLFSNDPLWFKRLIYEMRFDEVSAVYALFGTFYMGIRVRPADLEKLLVERSLVP